MPSKIDSAKKVTIKIIIKVEKDKTTTIEVEVKVKTYDMNKGELIDAIASGSKLTKADAGRVLGTPTNDVVKDQFKFRIKPTITPDGKCGCPEVEVEYSSRVLPTVNK